MESVLKEIQPLKTKTGQQCILQENTKNIKTELFQEK
jgi:hypothetical protein